MAINIPRGQTDEIIQSIVEVLEKYQAKHHQASIDLFRQNNVSVRVRIIDPDFQGKGKSERNRYVWQYLGELSDETQGDISSLTLITPDEREKSIASFDFDDPIPSML